MPDTPTDLIVPEKPTDTEVPSASAPAETPQPDPITALEQEVLSLKDQLLRRRAEFDNYRRRVERDQSVAADEAVISLLSDLLPSLDALEKALLAQGTLEEIRTGVEITLKDMTATLANRGIKAEEPAGQKFDPLRHQALSYETVPGATDGSVVVCYRKGYVMGDRLIRPALVQVARASAAEAAQRPESISH